MKSKKYRLYDTLCSEFLAPVFRSRVKAEMAMIKEIKVRNLLPNAIVVISS